MIPHFFARARQPTLPIHDCAAAQKTPLLCSHHVAAELRPGFQIEFLKNKLPTKEVYKTAFLVTNVYTNAVNYGRFP